MQLPLTAGAAAPVKSSGDQPAADRARDPDRSDGSSNPGFRRTHDAAKANVAGRSVNRLTLARRWPVAQAVVGRAEM